MNTYFNQQNNLGIMVETHHQQKEEQDDLDSISSLSDSSDEEEGNSASSSLSSLSSSSSFEMSSLMQQLPFKRGLSKHFQGKSQSFTSLLNVTCLEDLAKPETPCNKKLKSCKSYAGGLSETNNNKAGGGGGSPRAKKSLSSARGSWSSMAKRSHGFMGNKPPIPPQRTSSLFSQTPLFA